MVYSNSPTFLCLFFYKLSQAVICLFPHLWYGVHAVVTLHQFIFGRHAVLSFPHSCKSSTQRANYPQSERPYLESLKLWKTFLLWSWTTCTEKSLPTELTFIWRVLFQNAREYFTIKKINCLMNLNFRYWKQRGYSGILLYIVPSNRKPSFKKWVSG